MKLLTLFVVGGPRWPRWLPRPMPPIRALDFKVKSIKGEEVDLNKFKGKVVLVVKRSPANAA